MSIKTVAIIYGGKSTEHEVSIRSARNIAKAIDSNQFNTVLIAISKSGKWFLKTRAELNQENVVVESSAQLVLIPGAINNQIMNLSDQKSIGTIDVVFPIVHGTGGEDGSLQGLLKTMNIAFVGPGVIGSALCIDKEVTKRILNEAGIANSAFVTFLKSERHLVNFETTKAKLGVPMYIKPPNLGSSVGINKVTTETEFYQAIDIAFQFDRKVLIEQNIVGREIECAVMGNGEVKASPVGEVVTNQDSHTFYDYAAKYTDSNGSVTVIPAEIDDVTQDKIRKIAIETYQALCCEGMSRVDVFLTPDGDIYVNEVNTLPGFTDISMYPKLWGAAGISYSDVISQLLQLALDRHQEENDMKTTF